MKDVFIGLGSNLGDRLENLRQAALALSPKVRLQAASRVYETDPWGYEQQPAFLNQVLKVETRLSPLGLLKYLKQIEKSLGRQATFRYGPRVIDLDILFYGARVFDQDGLAVPHPRLHQRAFVLIPLAELAPHLVHPVSGKTVQAMMGEVDPSGVRLYH